MGLQQAMLMQQQQSLQLPPPPQTPLYQAQPTQYPLQQAVPYLQVPQYPIQQFPMAQQQQFQQPPMQQFQQPPMQQFQQPPMQQFQQPPGQQYQLPPMQQFQQPPVQQNQRPLGQQFQQLPTQQFPQPPDQQLQLPPQFLPQQFPAAQQQTLPQLMPPQFPVAQQSQQQQPQQPVEVRTSPPGPRQLLPPRQEPSPELRPFRPSPEWTRAVQEEVDARLGVRTSPRKDRKTCAYERKTPCLHSFTLQNEEGDHSFSLAPSSPSSAKNDSYYKELSKFGVREVLGKVMLATAVGAPLAATSAQTERQAPAVTPARGSAQHQCHLCREYGHFRVNCPRRGQPVIRSAVALAGAARRHDARLALRSTRTQSRREETPPPPYSWSPPTPREQTYGGQTPTRR